MLIHSSRDGMLSNMKKNISLLMCGRCTRTDTHDVGLKEGKRLKYVHVRAHVNVCPHSVTTLDQDMDRQGSRLREGTFGEEVLASDFFSAQGSFSRCRSTRTGSAAGFLA